MFLLTCGCASQTAIGVLPPVNACGFRAVRDRRFLGGFNETPPACGTPSVEEVALSCAIHDQISAPDFDGNVDEQGNLVNYTPVPKYRIYRLSCRFTNPERNLASCQFVMSLPGEPAESRRVDAQFQHRYWRDDGPAHHIEGTRWSLKDDCTPANPKGA